MPKVILKGFIVVLENDLDIVKSELQDHIALTRNEAGCIVFNVETCADDAHTFSVYEEFDSEESFELHQLRAGSSPWAAVTKNVQRKYTITVV